MKLFNDVAHFAETRNSCRDCQPTINILANNAFVALNQELEKTFRAMGTDQCLKLLVAKFYCLLKDIISFIFRNRPDRHIQALSQVQTDSVKNVVYISILAGSETRYVSGI